MAGAGGGYGQALAPGMEEEETETISEDGSSKEARDIVRTPQKVSLRSISSMTDEEKLNMRIKKFGIIINEEFRKCREILALDSICQLAKKSTSTRKRKERDQNALESFDILP